MVLDDRSTDNCSQVAQLFATFFESVYCPREEVLVGNVSNSMVDQTIFISKIIIKEKIKSLDLSIAAGQDGILSRFVRPCCSSFINPLFIVLNLSISSNVFPCMWKNGIVILIHKDGDKNNIRNYHPITLSNIFSRFFESILVDILFNSVSNVIIDEQHGFVKGCSVITNLCVFTDYLFNGVQSGSQIETICTDFFKAFDRINHKILQEKLFLLQISHSLIQWLNSYLTNRS